ncbi:MAG: bifunctional DNA-formamidopyrimidine glycosylase/DNA-(apurinic or apyrimidinic site) lyase [Candidatus Accumulibacter phosphatis]|jgi:formamidopyrimidine-DNA glycosylase|uniref:Formamidopyrimidine-DNA glycosylase n=2 Tax=Candidatus Accumulibacter TaxID=327159 RepID=A0A080LU99_9PROT|nr:MULTISPECIES: bifunctional DNA-formamidopyrimidine glycosylase/DNA-(apurinic or apyrimidinic site) lyase [Candidatus Accumulibacter]KFB72058.1 MAG: Formamidopyrimidine-DNA glycosylase [Candidatus Accumulibacter phosphatis]NMQ06641.1 bifunctional DNA-formamidopyrimidine glycosylase/DNA-(apurinic or apyrimidinic site) lyase [Candidatus Accumulibacter contiguus]HRF12698.1 bifunctional DNA-formamidopyrimidine glycosylase/DNA-(apurinic or apyrimidinic site) lyase [Candidatus Accumulibacter phospha
MPELPEVEVSRQGLLSCLSRQPIIGAVVRTPRLRHEIPAGLAARLAGLRVDAILRRGKYLLLDCQSTSGGGWLLIHFGMSGSLRLVPPATPARLHDHFDLVFADIVLRFRDPRRFGALLWHEGGGVESHPALAHLGIEPLSDDFNGDWLYAATRCRRVPIKPLLMDSRLIVGIGNIYAAESLHHAGVSPLRTGDRISRQRYRVLADAIRATLLAAIAAGGSSVRDYVHSDGGAGCFQLSCRVYGRAGEPCPTCAGPVRVIRQAGRSTFYCPRCQH